ncbi:chromosomal replication initiator protein DnaA [Candidatus Bipolaricaulota bacterium]|nr:chromosomal replication initiator protein DnaA [Candidatus Bipolaricaulota bacterium]TFH08695.1 MAG: chromosomal replication initiator protein DnaA [Candidatus Atribacteria bacterium]
MSIAIATVWESVLSSLKSELSYTSFETWFLGIVPLSLADQSLTIAVPDAFTKGGLERRFRKRIEDLASESCSQPISLVIQVAEKEGMPSHETGGSKNLRVSSGQAVLALNADYTFESFVRGKNCDLAYYASEAVAEKPGVAYNPLFLYGNVGLGKTHLLQAIGNSVLRATPKSAVLYTTSERFAIELINAIRNNSTASFRSRYRQIDLLLIDDIHFLEGKEATQEELFHTFNELYGREKQIVLSSDRAPDDLSGLQDRLVSRFRWGLVADIQPPDLETRIAILREKASSRGLDIDGSILEMIATRISSSVRALEGALNKVLAFADLRGEKLTPTTLEAMLPKEGQRPRLTMNHIKEEVAARFNLKRQALESSSRKKEISQARHIAIYLSRELTDHSFPAIGREFGNRDHSTAMHSYIRVQAMLEETPLLHSEINGIRESLASQYSMPH